MLPAASFVPAIKLPTITVDAPAARAFTISPGLLIPPSAIMGTFATLQQLIIAESCGTPKPVWPLVLQALPGPTPTLTAAAPLAWKSRTASAVATFPGIKSISGNISTHWLITFSIVLEWPCAISINTAETALTLLIGALPLSGVFTA